MDGYGVGLKLPPAEALKQWGEPTTLKDVSRIFSSYLSGTLPSIPWSEEPLRAETSSISSALQRLNHEHHWWTVGSQPAVDGAPSAHPVHGFGPRGGYVYQKAFVEFFLSPADLDEFERRSGEEEHARVARGDGDEGAIKWFASNRAGAWKTNMHKGDVNAVTWGVFGGKEIVTTTLIEEMSFRAWSEEAFAIWKEWSLLYDWEQEQGVHWRAGGLAVAGERGASRVQAGTRAVGMALDAGDQDERLVGQGEGFEIDAFCIFSWCLGRGEAPGKLLERLEAPFRAWTTGWPHEKERQPNEWRWARARRPVLGLLTATPDPSFSSHKVWE